MDKEKKLVSVIKSDNDNMTFVWKYPSENFEYGSQLIVHEGQEAVFFKDGQALDLFEPGRYTLETQRIPMLEKIYKLPADNGKVFDSEIYFINKTVQMAIKWGTPEKVRIIDYMTGVPLEIGASGEMNIQVNNSRMLLGKIVGTMRGVTWDDGDSLTISLQKAFRSLITVIVKKELSSIIHNEAIDLLTIDENLDLLSDRLKICLAKGFEEYGLTVPQFYITNILLPENDKNFQHIRKLREIGLNTQMIQAEATLKSAQIRSEAQYHIEEEKRRAEVEGIRREAEIQKQLTETEIARKTAERKLIDAQTEIQIKKMSGLAEAEVMQAKGYTQKDVIQAEVQKKYAEGLANMGATVSTNGGNNALGNIIGLGAGMAAANLVIPQMADMMKEFNVFNTKSDNTQALQDIPKWNCTCGQTGNTGNFCSNCGRKRG